MIATLLTATTLALTQGDQALLRGRVTGLDGEATRARVVAVPRTDPMLAAMTAGPQRDPVPVAATTDRRGRFRLPVARGSLYRVWAAGADGSTASTVRHAVRPGEMTHLRLLPAARIELEHPAGVARLAWYLFAFDRDRQEEFFLAAGRSNGRDVLPPLAPGRYRLRVVAGDAAAAERVFRLGPRARRSWRPVLVAPGHLTVTGTGAAAARLRLPATWRPPGPATAGPRLALPALGATIRVGVEVTPGRSFEARVGPVRPASELRWSIPARNGRKVEFDIGDADRPGTLALSWLDGDLARRRSVTVRASPLELAGLPTTDLLATYWGPNGRRAVLRIGATQNRAAIVATRGADCEITVVGNDGMPRRRAVLALFPRRLDHARGLEELYPTLLRYPDRRGQFRFAALPPGDWNVRVECPYHVPLEVTLKLETAQLCRDRLTLELGNRVEGRVLDSAGKPVRSVLVTLSYPLVARRTRPRDCLTDNAGHFAFHGLPDGDFILEARRSRGTRSEIARRRVRPPTDKEVTLKLRDEDPRRRKD